MSVVLSDLISSRVWADGRFKPNWQQELSGPVGGGPIARDLGPMLWTASYRSVPLIHADALDLEADLARLQGALGRFDGFDLRARRPRLAGPSDDLSTAVVSQISADRRSLKVGGVPVGLRLSPGDAISIEIGSNLHYLRVTRGAVADASGVTGLLEVDPAVRPEITQGAPIVLVDPLARFAVVPGSLDVSPETRLRDVVTFEAVQVFE